MSDAPHKKYVIALVVLVLVSSTVVGFSLFHIPPVYEASATLVATRKTETENSYYPVILGIDRREASLINSRPVAEETIERLGLRMGADELLENLTVERAGHVAYVELFYRDTYSRQRAKQIASTIAEVSSERLSTDEITAMVYGPVLVERAYLKRL